MDSRDYLRLREIACFAEKMLEALQAQKNLAKPIEVPLSKSTDIELSIDIEYFQNTLAHLSISNHLRLRLEALFKEKAKQLQATHSHGLASCRRLIHTGEDSENLDHQVLKVIQSVLDNSVRKISNTIIKIATNKISSFRKESDSNNDTESSNESANLQKGHSPRAVAILEKVFAQTNNINRSEKLQLAKATKLEPRQVTIWFQNRRNRKPASQAQSSIKKIGTCPTTQQRKRKFQQDEKEQVPQTPFQRRRLSESDVATLSTPRSFRDETPSSSIATGDRSSSVEMFESDQQARLQGDISCATSYDDSFSSHQSGFSSPPGSTFGMKSFDDQVVRFTNEKFHRSSIDYKKEMMFDENGVVQLDWDDLELNLEDFNGSMSQAISPSLTFLSGKQSNITDLELPNSGKETNDLIMSFARKLVEEEFNTQEGIEKVQQSEGWQTELYDQIFLAKEAEQDLISLADVQSSQTSNPSGPSTANSTQTSPKASTPRNLFSFDFDNLGLDDIVQYNNESIEGQTNSIDLFSSDELLKFDPLTSEMLGLLHSPSPSLSIDAQKA